MKLNDLIKSAEILNKLAISPLPPGAAFNVAMTLKAATPFFEQYDASCKGLFEIHVLKDADGRPVPAVDGDGQTLSNQFQIKDPAAYNKAMEELLNEEVAIQFKKLATSRLGDKCALTPNELIPLHWMLLDE